MNSRSALGRPVVGTIVGVCVCGLIACATQTPTTLPLPLPAPFNIAEIRYGLTAAPLVGTGSGGAYFGVQLQGDVVPNGYKYVPDDSTIMVGVG